MSSIKGFVEGGLAAVVAGCATHPLDLIKVRMQLQGEAAAAAVAVGAGAGAAAAAGGQALSLQARRKASSSVVGMGMKIVQKEGLGALFAGVSASALRHALYSTTRMGLYELIREKWAGPDGRLTPGQKVAAGLIAGAVGALVGNPADVAMVRMQADGRLPLHLRRNYASVADALVQMVRAEGPGALWAGSVPTIQRAMVVTAATLASYDQCKESLGLVLQEGLALHVAASLAAGLVASVVSNPIDVVKTRIQNMGAPAPYSGPLDCAIKTISAEGPLALYKGFVPTVSRQGPFTVTLFLTLEQIRHLSNNFWASL